ncbi:PAS and ANTAR domain-containing protein [Nocardioides carbamazepini]|uniref:PAS and ANTAR domain-containing protein n=1 Tax=Nocardioides carbamazepini TaxID=2854259 RepID=UPI00214A4A32|nr:PAS and ANTAR domain-containing protein [Nocardioides carbamazepini]MCR1785271.1 PAS and ANTAR domain-containing protein [Nocardioides carbamazepini]
MTRSQGTPRVGRFVYDVTRQAWTWDDEVYRIHGLEPDDGAPTTDYVLECKHPEDRARVANVLLQATLTGKPFSVCYRLNAADGVERRVVLVCEGGVCEDDAGADGVPVKQLDGYYVDLTHDFAQATSKEAREAVAASAEHRATIEQAKGSLMLAYGLDPDQAFAMLRWWSRNKNVKVREIAEHITEVSRNGQLTDSSLRQTVDHLLHDVATTTDA